MYHGFSDAQVSPYRSLWFYRALARNVLTRYLKRQ
jgi:hypothetical protein